MGLFSNNSNLQIVEELNKQIQLNRPAVPHSLKFRDLLVEEMRGKTPYGGFQKEIIRSFMTLKLKLDPSEIVLSRNNSERFNVKWFLVSVDAYMDSMGNYVVFRDVKRMESRNYNYKITFKDGETKNFEFVSREVSVWFESYVAAYQKLREYAWELGNEGRYEEAFKYYQEAAINGENADAQNSLGTYYQNGRGVEKDLDQALVWYEKAAKNGEGYGMSNAAYIYEDRKEYDKALYWLEKLIKIESPMKNSGLNRMGLFYFRGNGVEKDKEQAEKYFLESSKMGNEYADYNLGLLYAEQKKYTDSEYRYRKAAEKQHDGAMNNLGRIYLYGFGIEADYGEAVKWFKEAAKRGNKPASYNLGICCYYVEKNLRTAMTWFEKCMEQRWDYVYALLGRIYKEGRYISQSYTKAVEYFRQGAEKNYSESICELGIMYRDGLGVEQDYAKAIECFERTIQKNFGMGYACLGTMYAWGCGVQKDRVHAEELFQKALNKNNKFGKYVCAECWLDLNDEKKDYAIDILFELAAENDFEVSVYSKKRLVEEAQKTKLNMTFVQAGALVNYASEVCTINPLNGEWYHNFAIAKGDEIIAGQWDDGAYELGEFLEKNGEKKKAYAVFCAAYDQRKEDVRICKKAAMAYHFGLAKEVDYEKAVAIYERYLTMKEYIYDAEAEFYYASLRFTGQGCEKEIYYGFHMYKAISMGYAEGQEKFNELVLENYKEVIGLEFANHAVFNVRADNKFYTKAYKKYEFCFMHDKKIKSEAEQLKLDSKITMLREIVNEGEFVTVCMAGKLINYFLDIADRGYTKAIDMLIEKCPPNVLFERTQRSKYFLNTCRAYTDEGMLKYVDMKVKGEGVITDQDKPMSGAEVILEECVRILRELIMHREKGSAIRNQAIEKVFSYIKYLSEPMSIDKEYYDTLVEIYRENEQKYSKATNALSGRSESKCDAKWIRLLGIKIENRESAGEFVLTKSGMFLRRVERDMNVPPVI